MPRRARVLLLAALSAALVAADARALTADGRWVEGAPGFAAGAWSLGAEKVADARLVALVSPGREPPLAIEGAVVLRAGDLLVGTVQSLQDGALRFRSDAFGALTLPLDQVRAVAFAVRPLASFARLPDDAGAELANGDRLAGALSFVNDEEIGIDTGKRVQRLKRDRVALVTLAGGPAAAAPGDAHWLRLTGGDLVRGQVSAWAADAVAFKATYAAAKLAPWQVCALWNRGAAIAPLSSLPIAERKATPYFDEQPTLELDRAAAARPLAPGGVRCEHGLRLGARQELAWDLGAGAAALVGELAVDASAPRAAGATVTVFCDERSAATFECRAGEAPKPFSVPLAGAKRLRVLVDFAKPNRPGDGVDLGWAALIR